MATKIRIGAAVLVTALATASCSVLPAGPEATPAAWEPSPSPSLAPADADDSPYGFTVPERAAFRIRNNGCEFYSTGSGFALDEHTIITNRHVIEKPYELEVTSHDGRDIAVESSTVAKIGDIGIITTVQALEVTVNLADADPEIGDPVLVAGYPLGDELVVSTGEVLDNVEDILDKAEFVFETTADIDFGSSGSAAYNEDGEVIGVIYAIDSDKFTESSFMVPVSILTEILDNAEFQKNNKRACS